MEYKKVLTAIDPIRVSKYERWIEKAIYHLRLTADNITYFALLDEDTNKPINNDLICEIKDIIYKLEVLKETPIMKPYPLKNMKEK